MKTKLIAIAAIPLMVGCTYNPQFEAGVFHKMEISNKGIPWENNGSPVAVFKVRQKINDRFNCEYLHISNWLSGPPFDNEPESHLDTIGCSVSFGGSKR